jgi:hypothetical protein
MVARIFAVNATDPAPTIRRALSDGFLKNRNP